MRLRSSACSFSANAANPCKSSVLRFVDCLYVSLRRERGAAQAAVHVVFAYDADGRRDVLGLWINEAESKQAWMQIFDELKARGVEAIGFLSMDGVAGLEEGARAVFPQVVVQWCIVHLVRNAIRYIPRKEWGRFTKELKGIYGAVNAKQARERFEIFRKEWAAYPGAVAVWEKNFAHVEQLFSYGSAVRKIMYATNAVESVNASFRKVTKKGAFPNEEAVFKLLYLRVLELYGKWSGRSCAISCLCMSVSKSSCSNMTRSTEKSFYTNFLTDPTNELPDVCYIEAVRLLTAPFSTQLQERSFLDEGEMQELLQGFLAELPMLLSKNLQKCA